MPPGLPGADYYNLQGNFPRNRSVKDMKLISWNVNGIRACLDKGFLDFFRQEDADFFCIQETKMQPGQAEVDTPGYHQYWNSAERKGYSGTAVFAKREPVSVRYGLGIEEHDKEGRVITLEYPEFWLVTVYTPNSQAELARLDYRCQWEDVFRDYLGQLKAQKPVIVCGDLKESPTGCISKLKPIIICGDLNVAASEIDLKNPKSNRGNAGFSDEERAKFQELLEAGFTDAFRHLYPDREGAYTWWSYRFNARKNNAGWRIDYFITTDDIKDKIKDVIFHSDVFGSDHCPIEMDIDL